MKRIPTPRGPYPARLYYSDNELEEICSNALAETGYLPSYPQPIQIDRFIEKKFNLKQIICEPLPEGCLGYTRFGPAGVEQVYIAPYDEDSPLSVQEHRRTNSTLAHEAGHGLFQSQLYIERFATQTTFKDHPNVKQDRILCRTEQTPKAKPQYSGEWWEFQANRAIGALLMPRQLFLQFMEPYLKQTATLRIDQLPSRVQREAIKKAAEVFDVNEGVVRIRIKELKEQSRPSKNSLLTT